MRDVFVSKLIVCLLCAAFLVAAVSGCYSKKDLEEAYNSGYKAGLSVEETPQPTPNKSAARASVQASMVGGAKSEESEVHDYVLNTNSHKFHEPDCSSVGQMKDSNKKYFTGTREEVIEMGYDPCGNCKP